MQGRGGKNLDWPNSLGEITSAIIKLNGILGVSGQLDSLDPANKPQLRETRPSSPWKKTTVTT